MGQLDLFSLGTKTDAPERKEAEEAIEPVSTNDEAVNIAKEQLALEVTLAHQLHTVPKEEMIAEVLDGEKRTAIEDAVVFADARIRIKLKHVQKEEAPEIGEVKVKEEIGLTEENIDTNEREIIEAPSLEVLNVREVKTLQKRGRKSFKDIDAEVDLIEIPEDEILFQKQYYSISEVAGWFKVNTSLLRFWETEFDILKPRKNRKGDRMFRPEDVKNLQLIYHLLRDRKYTIDGAKDYIKGNRKKADTQLQLTQSLQKFKSFLLELKANLQ
ncbi:MAG TPA: MerR family transcriptional regulator [Segetibacter sp.]|jgi:DNA-binding transcriptional MerR regulator